MFNILFVCEGNTCRSPMAQALMADLLSQTGCDEQINLESAGLRALENQGPTDEAIKVMKQYGIDISHYRSKRLTESIVDKADLIFTMNSAQKNEILKKFKDYAPKILTLIEAAKVAHNFKTAIDSKVELIKGLADKQSLEIGNRLKSIADLGNIETSLETTVDGKAFLDVFGKSLNSDIFDPYGGTLDDYKKCAEMIEANIVKIISFVCDGGA